MYLKRLELSGFKTFADRTDLEFVPGITAIVGPNGSGKSNLSDAIRWALGEQRSHTLRGTKTEDFIFAGSAKRRAHGLGQVGLVLDNTDRALPLAYSDIGVMRRATRGGDGEFFLNGLPCRLRDLQLLFLGTGLGGRSYALIGQGEVDAVLNASPQERRLLLEEAAGLARYKRRRHESLRKLEHADAHLQRIRDLLTELQGQHAHLAEQAEAARQHRDYLQEMGSLEHALLADEARRLRGAAQRSAAQTELTRARLGELAAAAEEARREAESLARRREELTRGWEAHQRRLLEVVREQAAAAAAAERGRGRLAVHRHEEARLATEAAALADDLDRLSADLTAVVAERQGAEGEAAALQDELGEILAILETDGRRRGREGRFSEGTTGEAHPSGRVRALGEVLDRTAAALDAAVERLRMLEDQRGALDAEHRAAEGRRHRLESRLQALKESTAQFAGYEEGARSLLLAQRGSPDLHRGILGALVDQIDVEPAYRPAVEAALGRRLFCLLTRGVGDVREALAAVRSNGRGSVSFLPLDRLAAHHQSSAVPEGDGLLGLAAAFVSAHGEASRAVAALLRDVIIVADLDRGLALIASGHRGRAVTLAGEVLSPDGVVTVRGARNGERSPLSRRSDIDAAQRDLTEVKGTLEGFRDRSQALQREIQGAGEETRQAQQAHQTALDGLRGQVDAARLRLAGLEATRRGLAARQGDFDGRRAAIAARREQILAAAASLAAVGPPLEVEAAAAAGAVERLAAAQAEAQEAQAGLEADRAGADAANAAAIETMRRAEEDTRASEAALHRAEVRAAQTEAEWTAMAARLAEAGLEWSAAEGIALTLPRDESRGRLEALRGLLAAMGPVNMRAIDEQEALAARIDGLARQVKDLDGARAALTELVARLDAVLRVRFRDTFDAVSAEFGRLFTRLFEGGSGHLELVAEEPESEPGLEVVARLPGKPARALAALSGGERVLVALSLLFAMLRVHPSPFCVFDEVEAALDDANTRRFTTLLRELAEISQIIIITHNKGTMEAADVLYGITMEEPGVSSVLSVRLAARVPRSDAQPDPLARPPEVLRSAR